MKRARFSEEQIIAMLKEAEAGAKVDGAVPAARDLGRDVLHLAQQVRRAGGLGDAPAAPARGREPAAEGDRGRPGAGPPGAQGRAGKKRLRPAVKREMVAEVMATHDLSQRRACGLIGITRRSFSTRRGRIATGSYASGLERWPRSAGAGAVRCSSR